LTFWRQSGIAQSLLLRVPRCFVWALARHSSKEPSIHSVMLDHASSHHMATQRIASHRNALNSSCLCNTFRGYTTLVIHLYLARLRNTEHSYSYLLFISPCSVSVGANDDDGQRGQQHTHRSGLFYLHVGHDNRGHALRFSTSTISRRCGGRQVSNCPSPFGLMSKSIGGCSILPLF
jgi:hypothetical protein